MQAPTPPPPPPPPTARSDTWGQALAKTGGSMLLSIAVYSFVFGWPFATGFVLLILVHELGHVLAMWHYRLSASPPLFIPFIGALINLRDTPPNAKVEAVVGIGGPLLGSLGAAACYGVSMVLPPGHSMALLMLLLAYFGFALNLFNMLPVPPLDGGRVTAAISPRIWLIGVAGMISLMGLEWYLNRTISPILVLVMVFALPRVWHELRGREQDGDYYQISRGATWSIGVIYVVLGAILTLFYVVSYNQYRQLEQGRALFRVMRSLS